MVKSVGYKIVWDRQALDNLKEILGYLEKQSKQAPKIIKTSILEKLITIGEKCTDGPCSCYEKPRAFEKKRHFDSC